MKLSCTILAAGAALCHGNAIRGAPRQLQGAILVAVNDTFAVTEGSASTFLGNVLANDFAAVPITITSFNDTEGTLEVREDGNVDYTPAEDFVGTEVFEYTICDSSRLVICDTAFVAINVLEYTLSVPPTANNDAYTVTEGDTLEVDSILSNDFTVDSNGLFVCEKSGVAEGHFKLDKDGSFRYTARECFTGEDSFTYSACYKNFDDIKSNQATVKITISSGRPFKPEPQDDSYEVLEGEELRVHDDNGLLWNDLGGSLLYVDDITTDSGFEGSVDVDYDGSLDYEYAPGKLGDFTFKYKVCQDGWEACVECSEGKVTIKVLVNPAKPTSPPAPGSITNVTKLGVVFSANLVDTTSYDSRYTLKFTNFAKVGTFDGTFNEDEDGSYEYGNAPVGEDVFTFTVCYKEWPDLCANGQQTIRTISSLVDFSSRSGVATFYELRWTGQVQGSTCDVVPSVTLSCGGEGTLSLLYLARVGADDNAMCQNSTLGDGSLVCNSNKTSGVVFVECRDQSSRNTSNRELFAMMSSEPVTCEAGLGSSLSTISHAMRLMTSCNNTWVEGGMECNGTTLNDASGKPVLCYDTVASLDTTAVAPIDVSITSTGVDLCIGDASAFEPATLAVIGDADEELGVTGYPLQECGGDCDDSSECAGDLICFNRDGNEVVPGCVGVAVEETDYCIKPPQQLVAISRSGAGSFP